MVDEVILHAATSDWHIGNFGYRDRSDHAKIRKTVLAAIEAGATRLWIVGDGTEEYKFTRKAIAQDRDNQDFFADLADHSTRAGLLWNLLPGNHNPNVTWFAEWLRARGLLATAFARRVQVGQWLLLHGDEFDPVCNSRGKVSKVVHGAGWLVGNVVERVVPNFPESWANPIEWGTPEGMTDARAGEVGQRIADYAKAHALRIIAGHTHKHDFQAGATWQSMNLGACTQDAPFSFALFRADGWGQLIHGGEQDKS